MDTDIKKIYTNINFNIIETKDNIYYCDKTIEDVEYTPIPIELPQNKIETINIFVSNSPNNYWGLNTLQCRDNISVYKGAIKVFDFDEPALKLTSWQDRLEFLYFYVLDDRWVVSVFMNYKLNACMCAVHDIIKQIPKTTHILPNITGNTRSYSNGNYILIYSLYTIVKLSINLDANGHITIDYKQKYNNIKMGANIRRILNPWFSDINIINPDTNNPKGVLNVFYKHEYDGSIYSYQNGKELIGTINIDTLENVLVCGRRDEKPDNTQIIKGNYEYLAPDIIIQRPDLNKLDQYLVFLASDGRQISINIHEYEYRKEHRKFYYVLQTNTQRFFTLIYRKHAENSLLIYQVDRENKIITYRHIDYPCDTPIPNTTHDGRIVLRDFILTGPIKLILIPIDIAISAVCSRIPNTLKSNISRFLKQKIIYY